VQEVLTTVALENLPTRSSYADAVDTYRISSNAVLGLQAASEAFIVKIFEVRYLVPSLPTYQQNKIWSVL
jgi:histone H3/H4